MTIIFCFFHFFFYIFVLFSDFILLSFVSLFPSTSSPISKQSTAIQLKIKYFETKLNILSSKMDAFHLLHSFMLNTNFSNPSSLCTLRSLSVNPHSSWFKVEAATGNQKNNNNKAFDAAAFEAERLALDAKA